ncbi:hypothetical protein PAXRUDRAFT_171697 [Paxillus rubicundulus Ve08.2h10]|uniref:Uncharacterized protein n=1 Tax=Paxillus rubicundulus Ve08.2h10 TaxID=930991 RepID=A0A0D0CKN5_9AGAM|nr:hypothetical protein PAXRUDRAFT_171697 [Paxillus rubicundulus Ve08.2h10]
MGKLGHPRLLINADFVKEATSTHCNIRFTEIARILKVHCETLWLYRCCHGIEKIYSVISDWELDALMRSFKTHKPESGFQYLMGFL